MPRWTDEQKQAIDEEGTNILVSAGAGSGKTAVLSERALRKVTEGTSIDQILILTFTKAAAFEMMLRIRDKIKKAGISEQVKRIDKAYITTFDSFTLSVVRKYHDILNISKNVSIIDYNVITLLKNEILDDIFDSYYQGSDERFHNLISDFCLKDDREIKKYILDLNSKLDMKYDKREYINNYISTYYDEDRIDKLVLEYERLLVTEISKIREELDKLELYLDGDYYNEFLLVLNPLLEQTTYDDILNSIDITLPRLPRGCEEEVKLGRDNIKKVLERVSELCCYEDKDEMKRNYIVTKEHVSIILDIVVILDERINKYKHDHDAFEFVDISKLAIDIVINNKEVLDELKYYFNEIMIDEYQDTSDLQEKFIQLIKNHNTYMVGDIKQSIYRFRNANPYIFKKKYDDYAINNGGKKIDLNKNFRSRKEVLENINHIFDLIMDDSFGGAMYKDSHQMVFGNQTYLEKGYTEQDYDIEFYKYHVDKDSIYKKYNKEEIEAFIIANDMKKKVEEHYKVFDKDTGILRNVEYSDFVILMDRSSKFTLYKKIFEYLKVPLTILKDENIADRDEVFLIYRILKLIYATSHREFESEFKYAYVSVSRSYLFSLDDNEIFETILNKTYFETELMKKVSNIVDQLPTLDLRSLIEKIIYDFSFHEKAITVGNLSLSITTLEYFLNITDTLQELGYDYLRFIEYLTDIIENKKDIKIPISIESKGSCQIMTIHKSKGLEYPICYYSGLSATFNVSELKEKVLYDDNYGIIVPYFKDGYHDVFCKELMKNKYYLEEISEKIRLFYVALTRCKEKMIVVVDLEEENDNLNKGIVSDNRRHRYRSFLDMLKSIYQQIEDYIKLIDLDTVSISHDYKFLNKDELISNLESHTNLNVSEVSIDTNIREEKNYSKTILELLDNKSLQNIELGNRMHEVFELVDFRQPNLEELPLTDFEKDKIQNLLRQPLLSNIYDAKVYKEYEFIFLNNNIKRHGVIDLLLEYDDHIDIIDYKLRGIDDDKYVEQLRGYHDYISGKTGKQVNIYLYSILEDSLVKQTII